MRETDSEVGRVWLSCEDICLQVFFCAYLLFILIITHWCLLMGFAHYIYGNFDILSPYCHAYYFALLHLP